MLTPSEHWRLLPVNRRQAFYADRKALRAQGIPKDEVFAMMTGPGGKYEVFPKAPGVSAKRATKAKAVEAAPVAAAEEPAPFSPAKQHEDREAEKRRQAKFKERLCLEADEKEDHREWVRWAARWQPIVSGEGGVIFWDKITGEKGRAPNPGAVGLLEQACRDPGVFFKDTVQKTLGKGGELGDDLLVKERKREAELLQRLHEVEAELAERGEDAYT